MYSPIIIALNEDIIKSNFEKQNKKLRIQVESSVSKKYFRKVEFSYGTKT